MQVNFYKQDNQYLNFKAGLTQPMIRAIRELNIKEQEAALLRQGIKANFKNDKPVAGAMIYAINLCQEAFRQYGLPLYYLPPSIRVVNKEELTDAKDSENFGFCTWCNEPVVKNEGVSDLGAIYINEFPHEGNIEYFDKLTEKHYLEKQSSTNHFLGKFLHELLHNVHLNLILNKYGGAVLLGDNSNKMEELLKDNIPILTKFQIYRHLGKYACKSYAELFSETMSKMITDSLKKDSLELNTNPMEQLKKYPASIQNFIKTVIE